MPYAPLGVLSRRNVASNFIRAWQVFFTAMAIDCDPLVEGSPFVWSPDFYLPQIRWVAGVVFNEHDPTSFVERTQQRLLLLNGLPDFRSYTGLEWHGENSCSPLTVGRTEYSLDLDGNPDATDEDRLFFDPILFPHETPLRQFSEQYVQAVRAARRFAGVE